MMKTINQSSLSEGRGRGMIGKGRGVRESFPVCLPSRKVNLHARFYCNSGNYKTPIRLRGILRSQQKFEWTSACKGDSMAVSIRAFVIS